MTNDPTPAFDLDRFVHAQDEHGTYDQALEELRAERKTSHWMWFVFPQIEGLGHSAMAQRYAISSIDEARAYLAHPVLGARLRACVAVLNEAKSRDAERILGGIDAVKLRSSLTLFLRAAPGETIFLQALERFFDGAPDAATDARL
ncbi:MAG: hypothetical protein JWP97_4311 [Labilithrix sp.]|nr:hypothetical protein [Labilithrix sp.]